MGGTWRRALDLKILEPEEFDGIARRLHLSGDTYDVLHSHAVLGINYPLVGGQVFEPDLVRIAIKANISFDEAQAAWEEIRALIEGHDWKGDDPLRPLKDLFECQANHKARKHSPPPPAACEDEYLRGYDPKTDRTIPGPWKLKPVRGRILTPRDYRDGEGEWREAAEAAKEQRREDEVRKATRRVKVAAQQPICERRAAILKALFAEPEKSNRAIAQAVGVDHKTVGVFREGMTKAGLIPEQARTVGRDGKSRSAGRS